MRKCDNFLFLASYAHLLKRLGDDETSNKLTERKPITLLPFDRHLIFWF